MSRAVAAFILFVSIFSTSLAHAQQSYWVQIEANATLREAEDAARRYSQNIADVNGFRLGQSGWYAIALGPYTEAGATDTLLELRGRGLLPGDAYVSDSAPYGQQFWPVGANALANAPIATEPTVSAQDSVVAAPPEPEPDPLQAPEETRQEALRSEQALNAEERRELQTVLQWEGYYRAGIDGAFGPGTRAGMSAWQEANGFEVTGVLTTRQRALLLKGYYDMIDSMGLASVTDAGAGIEITLPTAMVDFTRYEAPFAHYEGDAGVRVVLISQRGDRATLWGLYDILQTLEVVPTEGDRSRRDNDFTIEGANDRLISYTYARLADGAVKGFMLIWPQAEAQVDPETGELTREVDRRRAMVLEAMRSSFASTGAAALDDNAGLDSAEQSIDLISGLEIRRAEKARSGVYVSSQGAVLTTTEAVAGCGRITLDESYDASVAASDDALGIVLLQPTRQLAPMRVAELLSFEPRLQSELAVAGYSYGGRLSSPTLTYGTLADLRGLAGEDNIARLAIRAQDGDTGGPVLDQGGAMVGLLLAAPSGSGRVLPADVGFIAKSATLLDFLAANGVTATTTDIQGALTPYDLSALAADITVLVSCWE